MTHTAYRLDPKPGSGFHLGREGLDQEVSAETFSSDSFFAALVATLTATYPGYVGEFMAQWPGISSVLEPPFRVSSLFPIVGDLALLPMPRLRANLGDTHHPGAAKRLKNLTYVSPIILERLLVGDPVEHWLPLDARSPNGLMLENGKVWISRDEAELLPHSWQRLDDRQLYEATIWKTTPVPRVTVDRMTNQGNIFHVGRTVFAEECGLWMLAEVNREGELLEDLLDILADQGIGGERNAGYGAFDWQSMAAPALPSPDQSHRVMTLSRYNPAPEEWQAGVLGSGSSYGLVDVGGWLATPGRPAQRRKRVRMIEVGSILAAPVPVVGRIVDVRPDYEQPGAPDHPVYRSGIALPIGVPGGTDG